jgi:AcrR family transcriptional regulator
MPRMAMKARQARRQQFIDAGWRCVARQGYRNTSVDDLCTEAGLSKGSFYTHFGQKQDLLLALLDADADGQEVLMDEVGGTHQSGVERIRRFLRSLTERGEDPAWVQLRADLWAEVANDNEMRERFAARVRERRAMLAGWIAEAQEGGELIPMAPNALASILLALADGLMAHSAADPGAFRWPMVRQAVGLLLDGLRP